MAICKFVSLAGANKLRANNGSQTSKIRYYFYLNNFLVIDETEKMIERERNLS
jgi:hypothetical protein